MARLSRSLPHIAGSGRNKLRRSNTVFVLRIESDVDFFPLIVRGQRKHVVGLSAQQRAYDAIPRCLEQGAVSAAAHDLRLSDKAVVAAEPDTGNNLILIRMIHG